MRKRFKPHSIEDDFIRGSTKGLSTAFGIFSSASERKKIMMTLEGIAKQQRNLRQEAEKRLQQYKKRNLNRQKQFYNILSRFNIQNNEQVKSEEYINGLYQKIVGSFNAFNQRAHQILQDRYGQMYRLMQRRIDIIMEKMEIQLKKNRNLSEAQIKNIRQQIKSMADVALSIQTQNITIRKRNEDLQLKNKLLSEQKKLLLQQINQKKQLVIRLAKKNKNSVFTSPRLNKNRQSNANQSQIQSRQRHSSLSNSIKLQGNNSIKFDNNLLVFQNNFDSIQFENSRIQVPSNRNSKTSRSYRNQNFSRNKTVAKKIINDSNPQNCGSQYKKTVLYLQQSLQRQKNKRLNLTKFSLQIQQKQKNISQFVEKQLKKLQKQQNKQKNEQSIQKVLKQLKKLISIPQSNGNSYEHNKKQNFSSKLSEKGQYR